MEERQLMGERLAWRAFTPEGRPPRPRHTGRRVNHHVEAAVADPAGVHFPADPGDIPADIRTLCAREPNGPSREACIFHGTGMSFRISSLSIPPCPVSHTLCIVFGRSRSPIPIEPVHSIVFFGRPKNGSH
jgi:hypothetical protein